MTLHILSTSTLLLREAAHECTEDFLCDMVRGGHLTDREALELHDMSLSYYITEAYVPCRLRMYRVVGEMPHKENEDG